LNNTSGSNTATGVEALVANTTGINNAAFGVRPLESNIDGFNNTAIGNLALDGNISGDDNVALGRLAGDGITTANNNIIIGHGSGVHSRFGQVDNSCYIGNIYNAQVNNMGGVGRFVVIDPDGKLGTVLAAAGAFSPQPAQPQAVPQPDGEAMLNRKVEELQATATQQQKQIAILTAQLKEQTSQIQKVSAQVEMSKPTAKVVNNP
jgi:hypothetical protein